MKRSKVPTIMGEYFKMITALYRGGNININAKNELTEFGIKLLCYLDQNTKDDDLAPVMRRLAARNRR